MAFSEGAREGKAGTSACRHKLSLLGLHAPRADDVERFDTMSCHGEDIGDILEEVSAGALLI
jgi:hypothetical protein